MRSVIKFSCNLYKDLNVVFLKPSFWWQNEICSFALSIGIKVLVGKPEGKRSFGRPRRRWEDNIKMDLQEVGGGSWGLDGVDSG
jgi:hypothetical protein